MTNSYFIDSQKVKLPSGVEHQHTPDHDTIGWSYRNAPINMVNFIAFLVGLLLAIISALVITYQIFSGALSDKALIEQLGIIVFFSLVWLVTFGALFTIISLTWFEAIKITNEAIIIARSGLGAPKAKGFNKKVVLELTFHTHQGDGHTFIPALSIVYGERWGNKPLKREQLAFWMRTKEKHQLFVLLQHILRQRGWDNIKHSESAYFLS